MVTGIGVWIFLLLCVFYWFKNRKIAVYNAVILMLGIVSSLLNVIAPGNYVRHSYLDSEVRLFQGAYFSIIVVINEIMYLLSNTCFGIIIIGGIIIGAFLNASKKISNYAFVVLGGGLTSFVSVYPICVGYSSISIPNRALFILDVVLILSAISVSIIIRFFCIKYCRIDKNRLACFMIIVGCLVALINNSDIHDLKQFVITRNVINGDCREYYNECVEVFDYLSHCKEEDVVLEGIPMAIEGIEPLRISSDSQDWVNSALAKWYDKKSVRSK